MIKISAKGAKHVKKRCSAKYQAMEEKLVKEYQEMQKKESKWRVSGLGWGVNGCTGCTGCTSPGENFKFCAGWFI